MPRIDPNESFEVAARHLFRHLHEPMHLKNNPLVERYFRDPTSGRFVPSQERAALEFVHSLVRKAAERCRQADIGAGEHERAYRHHTIATLNLLGQHPIAEIAPALGISLRQCYRERAELCERIAQHIREENAPAARVTLPQLDECEFRMRRAELRAEIGDVAGALREYNDLADSGAPPWHKIAALCESAMLLAWAGELPDSARAFSSARTLYSANAHGLTGVHRQMAQASIDLAGATLTRSSGQFSRALEILKEGRSRLEPIESALTDNVREMYVRILVACSSNGVWHSGDFHGSVACISKAYEVLQTIVAPSHRLALDVELRLCRRRNDMVTDSRVWLPAHERLAALAGAFDRTRASGSLGLGLYAAICLMVFHGSTDDNLGLADDIRYASSLLKQAPSRGYFRSMPYDIAEILLRTKYWEQAPRILASTEGTNSSARTTHPEGLDYVQAYCYLRAGRYRRAYELVCAQRQGDLNPHILAKMRVIGALSADVLGQRRQARAWIESAVSWLQRFGCAPGFREAYSAAAEITGDSHFRRTAEEISQAMGGAATRRQSPVPPAIRVKRASMGRL